MDQQTLETAVNDFNGAIVAQAAGGGTAATVAKNKKREVLNGLLRKLAHYVQANCNDDLQDFVTNSGFQARAVSVRSTAPPDKAQIQSVDNGHTTQLVVTVKKVPHAKMYQVQIAAVGANNTVGPFQPVGIFARSRSMTLTGLTPETVYAVQVRAWGGPTGFGDWSDALSHMCM